MDGTPVQNVRPLSIPKRVYAPACRLLAAILLLTMAPGTASPQVDTALFAGFRGSKIWGYTPEYWGYVADSMSRNFTRPGVPASVWILTFYGSNGDIYATFPSGGQAIPHVSFSAIDYNEPYLNEFDKRGVHVWLQVEPGAAPMVQLIDVVLNRYRHHSCVIGFGIDVEWLDTQLYSGGRQVSDSEASVWEQRVQAYDSSYTLFLKHYTPNRMPPSYRGMIIFIDDSQQFSGLTACVNEFTAWGKKFSPNKVGFQFGYPDDRPWWSTLQNPPAKIGNSLLAQLDNIAALFWVDFTIQEVFPPRPTLAAEEEHLAADFRLEQNYPNPFNPRTQISWEMADVGWVKLCVYDLLGREVAVLVDGQLPRGYHTATFDGTQCAGGTYVCRLRVQPVTGTHTSVVMQSRTMLLLR